MFLEHADRGAHSSFVNTYAETGFLGYFFWIGLLYVSLLGLWKVISRKKEARSYAELEIMQIGEGVFAALVGYLACGFFLSRNFNILLFIFIALATKVRLLSGEKILIGDILPKYYIKRIALVSAASITAIYLTTKILLRMY